MLGSDVARMWPHGHGGSDYLQLRLPPPILLSLSLETVSFVPSSRVTSGSAPHPPALVTVASVPLGILRAQATDVLGEHHPIALLEIHGRSPDRYFVNDRNSPVKHVSIAEAVSTELVEGEAGSPVSVVSLPGRRAGLEEDVKKLVTSRESFRRMSHR